MNHTRSPDYHNLTNGDTAKKMMSNSPEAKDLSPVQVEGKQALIDQRLFIK